MFEVEVCKDVKKVEFCMSELPNDMKMLAFIAGELSNAARFFSTFAGVNQNDANDFTKSLSASTSQGWKPFNYENRSAAAKKVAVRKEQLKKSGLAATTQRTQLTAYTASLKSRQEEVPLLGKYIDHAKSEPLHIKNNTTKELFMKMFKIVVSQSNLKNVKMFSEISPDNLFSKFIFYIRFTMGCNFLSKKMIRWFNENNGKVEKNFTFRFRGKITRRVVHILLYVYQYVIG